MGAWRFVGRSLLFAATLVAAPAFAGGATAAPCEMRHPELARGFSLTGWLDEPVARPPDAARLKALRERGFLHVRLPIAAESVMARFTPAATIAAKRRTIGTALDLLASLGFAVVVDLHGGDRLGDLFRRDPAAGRDAVIEAWRVLGPLVEARVERKVLAEVLNEPPVDDITWAGLQSAIVAAMRREMPRTTLVVSTGGPQRVERLTAAKAIGDADTVYAVHYYDPMVFTHQGAEWLGDDPIGALAGVPFPIRRNDPKLAALATAARAAGASRVASYLDSLATRSFERSDIERHFRSLADWSRIEGRPVVIGEFGVYRAHAAPADRLAWLAAVRGAAEANCIGWTHWDYRDGFGLTDAKSDEPDEAVLGALLGRTTSEKRPRG